MSPEQHAAMIVATLARMPQDDAPRPVPAVVVTAVIGHALNHVAELSRFGVDDLRRIAEAVADRIPYRTE